MFNKDKEIDGRLESHDVALMFQILILQRLYTLSDEQVEFQINDRQSFQRFFELHLGSVAVPGFSACGSFARH